MTDGREPGEIWWDRITGPRTAVQRVIEQLLDEHKHVLLSISSDIPWREDMRGIIQDKFNKSINLGSLVLKEVDVRDDCPGETDVGGWLLKNFGSRTEQMGYLESQCRSVAQYVNKKHALKDRLFWVKGMTERDVKAWIAFCREINPKETGDCQFVLECALAEKDSIKNFSTVTYDQWVNTYDVRLFLSTLLNERRYRDYSYTWKEYIATVCATLCGTDAEVAQLLLEETDFRRESPLAGLERVAAAEELSRRGESEGHVLSRFRGRDMESLERQIWAAQIQMAFPVIEFQRVQFIQAHKAELLPLLGRGVILGGPERNKTPIEDPMDLEVGMLYHIARHYGQEAPSAQALQKTFEKLRDLRNDLAHLKLCQPADLDWLFQLQ